MLVLSDAGATHRGSRAVKSRLSPPSRLAQPMVSIDIEIALVGLTAMLEPATLLASVLALVVGDRPLRTGSWFYLGGLSRHALGWRRCCLRSREPSRLSYLNA